MTPPRHTSRRSICRTSCGARVSMSQGRLVSRRKSPSGWRGGRSFAGVRRSRSNQTDGDFTGRGGAMRRFVLAVAASAAVLTAGCSALGRAAFKDPIVNLRSVEVRGLGLTGGTLDVRLSVYNPNGYRLDATRLTYAVAMA